jgi:hypothetical protein
MEKAGYKPGDAILPGSTEAGKSEVLADLLSDGMSAQLIHSLSHPFENMTQFKNAPSPVQQQNLFYNTNKSL